MFRGDTPVREQKKKKQCEMERIMFFVLLICKLLFRILYFYVVYYVRKYCKVLKVMTLITFEFSSLFPIAIFGGLLLSGIAKMCTADMKLHR